MADHIYRVNMTTLTCSIEAVPQSWMGLGGRGLTSTIVAAEVDPECHPLGPNNKLVCPRPSLWHQCSKLRQKLLWRKKSPYGRD